MRRLEYKWLVGITFVLALIMQILDVTILNVALATLGREFQVGPGALQWVLTGYMISLAVFIPSSGWIADRFGSKRTFQAAVIIFTLASVLCGVSTELWMLIAARVLQGVGGGMLVPVGQAMLFRAFPANERAKAGAVLSIPITVAPMLGPVLGGVLVEYADWRWIFFINVPVGALALLCAVLYLREEERTDPGRFDLPGFLLAGIGLASLLYGLEQGAQLGWGTPQVWVSLLVAGLLIAGLIWRELTVRHPMLDLRLLADRMFGTGNLLLLCQTGSMFGILFLLPLFLQNLRGVSPMGAGLVLMPQAVAMLLTTQVVSRVYGRIGPKRLILAGFAVQVAICAGLQLQGLTTSLGYLVGLLVVQGVAMGLLMTPLQTATFAGVSGPKMGQASSLFNVSRQVATALGTAIVATVLVVLTERGQSTMDPGTSLAEVQLGAYHGAFLVSAAFAVLGILLALRVRDADAAASLDRPRGRRGDREPAETVR
ncbi:drug resistance transporter, EmrB/QacA subfamily [Saccharopolyspora antimicrobica]|uniref:Drug resistance transporter, EmrB/QacA subfamily n=1 Tax=Saccharopolyspora antimicrobica TaxID=455193 RepID=A0A1I4Z1K7_9PSEU|nr:MDR family MFS transporter [Saccharopolyspora antimicrobica]RKT82887.1 EmrB/QacA subfamily drug resistance transporter [Saccharopolyspora antimicrobica]SFN43943.1 drug resistance transporter, EmrB/QacA subfamily [Saccharopolyspora antimicrobica]